jgi:drug/metabolite transporter (DMT)-like permease
MIPSSSIRSSPSKVRLKGDLILLLVAVVWGSGFVAQGFAARHLNALFFNAGRFLLAALILFAFNRFRCKMDSRGLGWASLAGTLLFIASYLQQFGLNSTTVGNAAFITGLYTVLVPILLALFWRQKLGWMVWAAALLAAIGTFLLSVRGGTAFVWGDLFELVGAVMWALHIIFVGRAVERMPVRQLALGQFLVCGVLSLLTGLLVDPAGLSGLRTSWQAVLYSGVFPIALGFTLQALGQKFAPPADAAIILSMEAVTGALFGVFLLGESLSPLQILGCALMLSAMILAQVKTKS